jgi:DNA repair exonuclease SbcCD ATPase subunit
MDEELVDLLTMSSHSEQQWEAMVTKVRKLTPAQRTSLWSQVVDRVAERPPPIRGDVSQDQWMQLCLGRINQTFVGVVSEAGAVPQVVASAGAAAPAPMASSAAGVDLRALADLRTRVEALERHSTSAADTGERDRLLAEIKALQGRAESQAVSIQSLRQRVEDDQKAYEAMDEAHHEEAKIAHEKHTREMEALNQQLEALKTALASKTTENEGLATKNAEQAQELIRFNGLLNEQRIKNEQAAESIKKLLDTNGKVVTELERVKEELRIARQELLDKDAALETNRTTMEEMLAQIQQSQHTAEELMKNLEAEKAQTEALNRTVEELRASMAQQKVTEASASQQAEQYIGRVH